MVLIPTRIIYKKIQNIIEESLGEDQFGFRKNMLPGEAILGLWLVVEERMRLAKTTRDSIRFKRVWVQDTIWGPTLFVM